MDIHRHYFYSYLDFGISVLLVLLVTLIVWKLYHPKEAARYSDFDFTLMVSQCLYTAVRTKVSISLKQPVSVERLGREFANEFAKTIGVSVKKVTYNLQVIDHDKDYYFNICDYDSEGTNITVIVPKIMFPYGLDNISAEVFHIDP